MLAIMMSNAGGAWDNAKKLCERLQLKKTDQGKACVVGDTVGDPFKDTSGPALNILIKLMSMVSLVFATLFTSMPYEDFYWGFIPGGLLLIGTIVAYYLFWSKTVDITADVSEDVDPEGGAVQSSAVRQNDKKKDLDGETA